MENLKPSKKEHGEFKTIDDLERVKGVGKVRLEVLRDAFMVVSKKSMENGLPHNLPQFFIIHSLGRGGQPPRPPISKVSPMLNTP